MYFPSIAVNRTLLTWFLRVLRWARGSASRVLILLSWVIRSIRLYPQTSDCHGQHGYTTVFGDGVSDIHKELDVDGSKPDSTMSEDGIHACKETLQHGSSYLPPTPFFAMASGPSSIPPVENLPSDFLPDYPAAAASSVNKTVDTSSVELDSNQDTSAPFEPIVSLPSWLSPSLPDDVSSARYQPKPPSSVAFYSEFLLLLYIALYRRKESISLVINPFTVSFQSKWVILLPTPCWFLSKWTFSEADPSGWERYVHPVGQLYFCSVNLIKPEDKDKDQSWRSWQYLTDANLYNEDIRREIEKLCAYLDVEILLHLGNLPIKFQVVIYYYDNSYGYYMVTTDPESRCIFWLSKKDLAEDLKFDLMDRITSPAHLSMYLPALLYLRYLHDNRTVYGFPILEPLGTFPSLRRV